MSIYVAGPVLRSPADMYDRPHLRAIYEDIGSLEYAQRRLGRELDFLTDIYTDIMRSAVRYKMRVSVPGPERALDVASPKEFIEQIHQRIRESERVITVYTPFDAAGPIETAYASFFRKRILILARQPKLLPRMMLGLPGVHAVVEAGSRSDISDALSDFLSQQ
jgi:hypothetical protein